MQPQCENNYLLGVASREAQFARTFWRELRLSHHADAQFNLGVLLTTQGDAAGADVHFREAVRLDERYAAYLNTP